MSEKVDDPKHNNDGGDNGGKPKDDPKPKDGAENPSGDHSQPKPHDDGKPKDTRIIPESYELKIPKDSLLDEGYVKEVAAFAKSHKLTNDEAQAILERENAFKAAIIEGQQEELEKSQDAWIEETKKDNEIGGDKYEESTALAKRVVDKFGTPAFKKALIDTGLGDHPEVIRIFMRMGTHLKDDSFIRPGDAPTGKRSMEDVFYGNSNKDKKE